MTIETLTYVQIASIIVYIFSVLGLYKILTELKDASIQNLQIQVEGLKHDLTKAIANTPDKAVVALSDRIQAIYQEIERLKADNDASSLKIYSKEKELQTANQELHVLSKLVERAGAVIQMYACPHCQAPRIFVNEWIDDPVGDEEPLEHIEIVYDCNYETIDGKVTSLCKHYKADIIE